jgi:hypothetical protein
MSRGARRYFLPTSEATTYWEGWERTRERAEAAEGGVADVWTVRVDWRRASGIGVSAADIQQYGSTNGEQERMPWLRRSAERERAGACVTCACNSKAGEAERGRLLVGRNRDRELGLRPGILERLSKALRTFTSPLRPFLRRRTRRLSRFSPCIVSPSVTLAVPRRSPQQTRQVFSLCFPTTRRSPKIPTHRLPFALVRPPLAPTLPQSLVSVSLRVLHPTADACSLSSPCHANAVSPDSVASHPRASRTTTRHFNSRLRSLVHPRIPHCRFVGRQ